MKQWLVRRGLLSTVPVAALVLAFGACSSEPNGAGKPAADGAAPDAQATDTVDELLTTPQATERLARLAKQFVQLPATFEEPAFQPPPGMLPPKPSKPESELGAPRAVLGKGDAKRFLRQGSRLR